MEQANIWLLCPRVTLGAQPPGAARPTTVRRSRGNISPHTHKWRCRLVKARLADSASGAGGPVLPGPDGTVFRPSPAALGRVHARGHVAGLPSLGPRPLVAPALFRWTQWALMAALHSIFPRSGNVVLTAVCPSCLCETDEQLVRCLGLPSGRRTHGGFDKEEREPPARSSGFRWW